MASTDPLHAIGRRRSTQEYCPECGQSLSFGRSHTDAEHGGTTNLRSIFLVVVGAYLSLTFALAAWNAGQNARASPLCNDIGTSRVCDAGVRDVTLVIASGKVSTADAFAARISEQNVRRDERFAAVGLAGVVIGLSAFFLRRRGSYRFDGGLGVKLMTSAEWLATLAYAEIVLLCAVRVANVVLVGTPITWNSPRDIVDQVLTALFVLAQGG